MFTQQCLQNGYGQNYRQRKSVRPLYMVNNQRVFEMCIWCFCGLCSMHYNVSKNLNQQMGNCAGAKGKGNAQPRKELLNKPSEDVHQVVHKVEEDLPKQQIVVHHEEPKSGHQNQHHKEQHQTEEVPIVETLQIQSAKKQIVKEVHHEQIKESGSGVVEKAKSGISQLKESLHNHEFTFQNSLEQEETVPQENVGSFRNNNVRINFEIRAN